MGMAIRFSEEDVRAMGRTARGVRSINLKKDDDAVVGMVVVREDFPHLLSISEQGFGKRTGFDEYRVQGRGLWAHQLQALRENRSGIWNSCSTTCR